MFEISFVLSDELPSTANEWVFIFSGRFYIEIIKAYNLILQTNIPMI